MAKKKFREILVDYPPESLKERIIKRQVKWPESLYNKINSLASEQNTPFMHIVINTMRFWANKQDIDNI